MLWCSFKLQVNIHSTGICGVQAAHYITKNPGDAGTSITSFIPRFAQLDWENFDKKEEIWDIICRNTAVLYLFPIFIKKNDNKSQTLRNGCNKHGVLICKLMKVTEDEKMQRSPWKPPAQTRRTVTETKYDWETMWQ